MKTWKTVPLLVFLVVGGCLMLKGSEQGSEDKERQAIVTFFDNYLNGKAKEFDVQRKFKVGDLETARAKVWLAWRDANTHFQEQKQLQHTLSIHNLLLNKLVHHDFPKTH